MIARTDVLARLERGVKVGFLQGQKAYTPLRTPFAREAPSDGAFEIYSDLGAVPWPAQNAGQAGSGATDSRTGHPQVGGLHEGGPITVLGGNERGLVVFNNDWDIPIGIWHNAINDDRIGGLEEWARSAGQRFEQHKDYLCFNALNAGAGTTYGNCYDGLSFFNDSHVDPGAEYQTAQDNSYALTLTLDNWNTVVIAGAKFRDDRGQPMGLDHSLLIHPPDLRREAFNICENEWAYDTANRERNAYQGTARLQSPGGWLDTTAWFAIDPNWPHKPIILQTREGPKLVFWDDYTQGNGIRYYKWVARYAVAYGDWRLCLQGNT